MRSGCARHGTATRCDACMRELPDRRTDWAEDGHHQPSRGSDLARCSARLREVADIREVLCSLRDSHNRVASDCSRADSRFEVHQANRCNAGQNKSDGGATLAAHALSARHPQTRSGFETTTLVLRTTVRAFDIPLFRNGLSMQPWACRPVHNRHSRGRRRQDK